MWARVDTYLRSSAGAEFLDDLVLGSAIEYEVEEMLADFGIPDTPANRRELLRLADALVRQGY